MLAPATILTPIWTIEDSVAWPSVVLIQAGLPSCLMALACKLLSNTQDEVVHTGM